MLSPEEAKLAQQHKEELYDPYICKLYFELIDHIEAVVRDSKPMGILFGHLSENLHKAVLFGIKKTRSKEVSNKLAS